MSHAAGVLVGEHDFSAFMAAGSSVKTTVRELVSLRVSEGQESGFFGFALQGRCIRIEAEGTGFLRHMVRNIAGTLVEVGKGGMKEDDVKKVLVSGDRGLAGPTAPAHGLFLEYIGY